MRAVACVVVSAAVVVGLVGCTSPQEPLPGVTASAAVTSAPSATPTPSPTIDYSDPDVGIVFEDDPDLTGDEAEVYHWAATLQTEYWRSLTTSTVSPKFSTIASPEIQAQIQQFVDGNAAIQLEFGGQLRVGLRDIVVDGDTASAVACLNYSDATFTDPNGSYTADEVGFGGTSRAELTLARLAEQTWIVLTSTVDGTC